MTFTETLKSRGLLQDISDPDLANKLPAGTPFYVGFDPTAPSLQLGNLVPIITAIHLARAGLKPIILFGGATGAIGDPSGKNAERTLLPQETIERNVRFQQEQLKALLARHAISAKFVNNYDWTSQVSVLDFLREVGKYLTVNYMIAKEVVKTRLEDGGISYTEFSYMLLQGADFLHLYQNENCRLQIGGSDQWGNITAGLELIRKKIQGDAYAFSMPLITDASGKKFGKSEGGAIWMDPKLTSPFKLHQYLINVPDAEALRFLKVFTFLELSEIAEIEKTMQAEPEKRAAQNRLADELCNFIHGEAETIKAHASAKVLFGGSIEGIAESALAEIFADVPSSSMSRAEIQDLPVLDLFVSSGLSKSKGEARRLIESNGAYLNNERISGVAVKVQETSALTRSLILLRSGKKSYHLIKLS